MAVFREICQNRKLMISFAIRGISAFKGDIDGKPGTYVTTKCLFYISDATKRRFPFGN